MAIDNVQFPVNKALAQFKRTSETKSEGTLPAGNEAKGVEATTHGVEDVFVSSGLDQQRQETLDLHAVATTAFEAIPDVRAEKLEEVRERMLNGDLDTEKVREEVAKSLERVMGILDLFVS